MIFYFKFHEHHEVKCQLTKLVVVKGENMFAIVIVICNQTTSTSLKTFL